VIFLFGTGLIWVLPYMIENPSAWKDVVSGLNAGKIFFFGLFALVFLRVALSIYRGISILTGFRLSDRSRAFLNEARGVLRSLRRFDSVPEEKGADISENTVSIEQEESDYLNVEKKSEAARKSFTTSAVIKFLYGFAAVWFGLLGLYILYQAQDRTDINGVSILVFLVKGGLYGSFGFPAVFLATYLLIRQRKIKRAVISMVSRRNRVEIGTIVRMTGTSGILVKEAVGDLQREGTIPDDIPVIGATGHKEKAESSA